MTSIMPQSSATLAGDWTLTDINGDHRCVLALPGDGISALHDAGEIPDPYWGRNEHDLRWIGERDWTATRSFTLNDPEVDLLLSGVDTVASVRVNGRLVLEAKNSFREYRVSLSEVVRVGDNEIEITFHSPVVAGQEAQDRMPFFIPYSADNSPIPNGNMLRKMQCDFGWDWNIALAPFGVYGGMEIVPAKAARIDRLAITQAHADGSATLSVTAHVSYADGEDFAISFAGQTQVGVVVGQAVTVAFTVENPNLWWPAGQGAQHLYDLRVQVGDAVATRRIGLRKMELVTEKDDIGLGFKFRVNGRDVFAKGANWIPADALAGRITDADTRELLQSAVDANMNMIRVWGGGRYEPTSFYEACDALGLMVWQDFMFACNLYPSTPEFLSEVRAEVHDNVARLHHHACVALWCGDNELIGALGWFEESRKDCDRYLVSYDRLNRCIEDALMETDPAAIWWPSSPSPGPMNFGDAWHDDGSGDMHFWSVWHEGRDFDHYRDIGPRFCSEFGFQSYPSMNVIREFAGPEDFNIAAPVLESHQKNAGGNARIAETMFRYFRWPQRFEDFVYLSQVQQGLAIKTAVTHWRSLKPRCMGTLIWQLNDTWPVCSWSSLDHGGGWKLMHHMAKEFYRDVLVTAVPDGDDVVLRAVNDAPGTTEIAVTAYAVSMEGTQRVLARGTVVADAVAVDVLRVPLADLGAQELLRYVWDDCAEIYAPRPYKHYALLPADVTCEVTPSGAVWELNLRAEGLALFVAVEADVPGRMSGNAFDLMPGETRKLTFTPKDPAATPKFTLRDLYSATAA